MRSLRFLGADRLPHLGILGGDGVRDLGRATPDRQRRLLGGGRLPVDGPVVAVDRWLPPVAANRIFAVGRNYAAHAGEGGHAPPTEPIVWMKLRASAVGHESAVVIPAARAGAVDFEGELAVVIGRAGFEVPPDRALELVGGYTVANDVTARDLQERMPQWTLAKSLPGFCPLGPVLVTADEIPDPQALHLTTRVNGEVRQSAPTADMLYSVATLVSFLSGLVPLQVGDVIETGTPAGVGWHAVPRRPLRPGDVVEITIEPIGTLRTRFVAAAA